MSEPLLNVLKLCLLALLYLFFLRVLRAVWAEVSVPTAANGRSRASKRRGENRSADEPASASKRKRKGPASELVVVEPSDQRGRRFTLGDEITVGRAAGCQVTIDDTYVSQLHARVFLRDGQVLVEDLGSTNGTYLNRTKVSGPMVMQRGDRLQVGNTIMEVA